ncbi:hypothetical protein SZN_04878 [Streptomyces zinciresistens K42]|uniref:RHS repeat-associated core domain-containing protein n=1 Tax=Streptomyces zinciresistens K42 TaxID=700597 RepID=G2G668_9ACTN|nr:hypothetical protein SZN_04878 [Streptomyces zinciresistens K42]
MERGSGTTWTLEQPKVNHYDGEEDNPRWIVEDATTGALTRNVDSASGDLAATTGKTGDVVLQLTNLHGDVALQLPLDAGKAPVALDSDEYGNPRAGQSATRYAWLGGKQRSTETLTGLTLMGVRLYNPASGRFLSTDPIYGGNANAYDYCSANPLNCYDLDGRWGWLAVSAAAWACSKWCPGKRTRQIAGVVSAVSGGGFLRSMAIKAGTRYIAKRSVKNSIQTKRGYRVDVRGKKPHYNKWGARPKGKGPGARWRQIRYKNKHMGFPHVQYYRGGKGYGKWAYRPGLRHIYRAWRSL